ncbi:hypothetical protein SUDANB121_04716 [Nocardiopsis dassonvillei]|uniref:hypothetical protein n=1 Tax=Nocardiopsis dassonvillei TaxID=2014 RepID=UPI003F572FA4
MAAVDADSCRVDVVERVTLTGGDRFLSPLVCVVIRRTGRGDLRRAKRILEQAWKNRP